jgi:hypothetical protein
MLPGEGRLPVIAEPVDAVVRLPMPGRAVAYTLDPTGKRQRELPLEASDHAAVIELIDAQSIWCEVTCP